MTMIAVIIGGFITAQARLGHIILAAAPASL